MIEELKKSLTKAAQGAGIETPVIHLEHPEDLSHGDFSTNLAMVHAKTLKQNPKILAEKIVEEFKKDIPKDVVSVSIAGPGFINFKIKDEFFVKEVLAPKEFRGKKHNKRIIVEHTQPNPFKEFHIGHLMNNIVGESISRILDVGGIDVKQVTYHGDVGMHIAQAVWHLVKISKEEAFTYTPSSAFFGEAYAKGNLAYTTDEAAKKEILEINKRIYGIEKGKEYPKFSVEDWYRVGREFSLKHFDSIYQKLGSTFDDHFYESESGEKGKKLVEEYLKKGVFEVGENGAVVFRGENFIPKTHTRVFLNSEGLPTYEAKEVGLAEIKKQKFYPYDSSITVTANEQDAFFDVVEVAIGEVFPELKGKLLHLSHGMLKLTTGKMSSRTGNVISGEALINETKEQILQKIADRNFTDAEKEEISEVVAVGALKYAVLRQAIGGDIIYDKEKSISFEGDSGPYLQYACVRAGTILIKTKEAGIKTKGWFVKIKTPETVTLLEKLLTRFPEVVTHAREEYAPHHITTYLTELAAAFNSYYANNLIIDTTNPLSPYRVALTGAFVDVMTNGLWLLGIKVPKRM